MQPDEPNNEEELEKLPEDGATPFSPAGTSRDPSAPPDDPQQMTQALDDTHPTTDTNIEPEEAYDEGLSGAAEASEPNAGDDVVTYRKSNPLQDKDDDEEE